MLPSFFLTKLQKIRIDPVNQGKNYYSLSNFSSDTDNFFLPLALLAASILRPFAVAMRSRKPCLFFLFLFEGWYVLFVIGSLFWECKNTKIL